MNSLSSGNKADWQTALMNVVTNPEELLTLLDLDLRLLDAANAAIKHFPLKVPHSFIRRMQKNNINDPLLRQVLPIHAELVITPGYVSDPLQESRTNPIPGLLHKYHGRVLLTLTGTCGVNCRYCFRREFPYEKNNPGTIGWNQALHYIAQDSSITEVILSGGDPLVVSDSMLKNLLEKVAAIPHVKRLRIHSRMPIVLPERMTSELIELLTQTRLKTVLVVHCNHPQEIDAGVIQAMQQIAKTGITLLNQSVLLKGVNDDPDVLIALSEALFDAGIQPYYLHVLDKVQGAAHFDLEIELARELHWAMAKRLPGYLVPKLVCEQPGAPAKLSIERLELCTD